MSNFCYIFFIHIYICFFLNFFLFLIGRLLDPSSLTKERIQTQIKNAVGCLKRYGQTRKTLEYEIENERELSYCTVCPRSRAPFYIVSYYIK